MLFKKNADYYQVERAFRKPSQRKAPTVGYLYSMNKLERDSKLVSTI